MRPHWPSWCSRLASPARAGLLTENLSGRFGPTTTLGGVALGADTAFTLHAVSDTSLGFTVLPGLDVYAVTSLTLEIAGRGTFIGIPDIDTNIFLADLTLDPNEPFYQVGIVNSTISGGFGGAFATATPGFSADEPTSSNLTDFLFPTLQAPYRISLAGVAGGLVVNDLGSGPMAATLVVSVPEPASIIMLGSGLVALVGCGRRLRASTS